MNIPYVIHQNRAYNRPIYRKYTKFGQTICTNKYKDGLSVVAVDPASAAAPVSLVVTSIPSHSPPARLVPGAIKTGLQYL